MLQRWGRGREAGEKTAVGFWLWPLGDSSTIVPLLLDREYKDSSRMLWADRGSDTELSRGNQGTEKQSLAHSHILCKWGKPNVNPGLSGHGADVPSNTL